MKRLQFITLLLLLTLWNGLTSAQGSCPAQIQLAFSRAYGACSTVERNQACYGGGNITSALQSTATDVKLTQAGDIIDLDDLLQISVDSPDTDNWSSAFMRLQATYNTSSQRSLSAILIGTAQLANHIESLPQLTANPRGTVNIRALPRQNADIIARVNVNGLVTANGRNDESNWIRVFVPNSDQLGWVSTEIVTLDGDINTLTLVEIGERIQQPFEQLTLTSSADVLCDGAPASGLLLQTPGLEESATLNINGVVFNFAGTAFIQAIANDFMTIHMMDGTANISVFEEVIRLAGGTRLQIPLDNTAQVSAPPLAIEPYEPSNVQSTPYLYLGRRVQLADPLSSDDIAQLSIPATPTPEPVADETLDTCRYHVTSNQNIRNGPGTVYDITQTVAPNTRVYPRARTTDVNGTVWLQVGQRAWVQANAVQSRGECNTLPQLAEDFIRTAKRNTLPLEDCQPTNGPIEVGQRVTIEFIPRAWENFASARDATYYNRGQILVGEHNIYPWVSDPIKISDNEYIRRFFAEWTAELGTHRIEGNHYSYQIICTITVVAGA